MEKNNPSTLYELLHKLVYADKKVTKQQIKGIDICNIIQEAITTSTTLKQASIILLALAKVLNKKFKALEEDCKGLFQFLGSKKIYRIPSARNITLNVEDAGIFLNDAMVDIEETILDLVEESFLVDRFENAGFEVDFGGDPLSIEQARNSTLLSGEIHPIPEDGSIIKRRRLIQDRAIEIEESIFRRNLRSVVEILQREKISQKSIYEPRIHIDPKVERIFERIPLRGDVIEDERQASVGFDEQVPDFSFNPVDGLINNGPGNNSVEEGKEDPQTDGFDLLAQPDSFIFGFIVQNYSVFNKASAFVSLLAQATQGAVTVFQERPFCDIECRVVRR